MRKVPVVESGNGEHPGKVKEDGRAHCEPTPTRPDGSQAAKVKDEERDGSHPFHSIRLFLQRG